MEILFFLIIIVVLIAYFAIKEYNRPDTNPTMPSQISTQNNSISYKQFEFESPRLIQIIQESVQIINKTKNPEVALKRYDTVKEKAERLFQILPEGKTLTIELNGHKIQKIADLYVIEQEKKKWLEEHDKDHNYPEVIKAGAISQWVQIFNKAIADGQVSEEELLELDALADRLGLTEKDTYIYWTQSHVPALPKPKELPAGDLALDIPNQPSKWVLKVAFGKAQSKNFNQVLSSVQVHPNYKLMQGPNNEEIHEVTFSPEEILEFEQLWLRVKGWKSSVVMINDEIIDRNTVSKWLICYRDKLHTKTVNPTFCFGASPFTFNLFGCHRIKLRDGVGAMGMEWYHIGKFDHQGTFHVDKEAITAIIKRDIYPYKICPALNIEKIKRGLSLLPDKINPKTDAGWTIENHYTGIQRLVPVTQWKDLSNNPYKISTGGFDVQMNVAVRTIDYYSSVSPQFKKVMEIEIG